MNPNLPALTPITSRWMHQLIGNFDLLEHLLEAYGSPINLHHLKAFQDNIEEYQKILDTYQIKYQLFFARKANKFKNLIPAAAQMNIGIDTASYPELQQCLDLNISSDKLISTAAIKNKKLLQTAIEQEVLLIIDNQDEFDQVLALSTHLNKKVRIGIRISGFDFQGSKLKSRFGFDITAVTQLIERYFTDATVLSKIRLEGFHFHLDGYSTAQRGTALHQTLDLIEILKPLELPISFIDIGGGILMNYLQSQQEWDSFQHVLKQAVLEQHPSITYNNDGLGFTMRNGELEGHLQTYPYYNENTKANFLKEILETPNQSNKTVVQRLQANSIELRLEPGRSLLDQVGITVARVAHRKIDAEGNHLIGLEMNMSQLKSSSADFLLDPFVSYKHQKSNTEPVPVYFTGAYCLERDILLKRKIMLPQLPEIGDAVLFVNTAGYMMHFFETEAHLFERAQNLSIAEYQEDYHFKNFDQEY